MAFFFSKELSGFYIRTNGNGQFKKGASAFLLSSFTSSTARPDRTFNKTVKSLRGWGHFGTLLIAIFKYYRRGYRAYPRLVIKKIFLYKECFP